MGEEPKKKVEATPEIADVYARYPHIGAVLPAVGYDPAQLEALRQTIEATDADVVVAGTPSDLASRIELSKPVVRARYEFAELSLPRLSDLVEDFLSRYGTGGTPA